MISITETITGSEPLSLSEVKSWLRVDYSDEDTLITSLISEARNQAELYLGVSIIEKSIVLILTDRSEIQLPYGPVSVVSSVVDENDDALEYDLLAEKITFDSTVDYAKISYSAGMSTVPSGLEMALKQIIMRYYENRGDDKNIGLLPNEIQSLKPHRRKLWF